MKKSKTFKKGKVYAKELVKKATYSEKKFKQKLSYFGFNFNFQKPFSEGRVLYIADFYIPLFGLIIEIDGGYHTTIFQQTKDKRRNTWFRNRGYSIWRMTNKEACNITTEELAVKFGVYKRLKQDNP